MRKLVLLGVLAAGGTASAAAQTVGTPVFMAPYRAFTKSEISGTFSDPGAGWALEGAYRYGQNKFDVGFRAGILNISSDGDDQVQFLAGVDVRFRVIEHTEDFPLDGALTAGIGGSFGDFSQGFVPVGLSLGRRVELDDGFSFVPYLQPVIGFTFGDDSDAIFAVGLGVDFKLSKTFDLRITGGLGDIDGIGIGFAWIR
jgi:opacity protein-like surface antigen